MARQRNQGIDTLRGLACLLLVALHVIGEAPGHGLRIADDHPLALFAELFFHLRMPLFAMLSGFVYGYRPVEPGGRSRFLRGKLGRLGLPYLFAATAFLFVNIVLAGPYALPAGEIHLAYLLPYAQFWFLQALLLIFVVMAAADTMFPRAPLAVAACVFIVSALAFLSPIGQGIELLSFDRMLYLLPFFAFGLVLHRMQPEIPRTLIAVLLGGMIILFTLNALDVFAGPARDISRRTAMGLALGVVFSGFLLVLRPRFEPLAWIGRFSFTIFLYHLFAVEALQWLYSSAGRPPAYLGLAMGVTAGIACPIVFHLVVLRMGRWPARIMLGMNTQPARPESVTAAPWPSAPLR
ncbi:acyltransferase family protein [Hyphobacterium sp.]|uniref:acyltransferase family protein n=1 Tax=Hyphobacterium sp. TaxID=2004662 RepID=UPI003B523242